MPIQYVGSPYHKRYASRWGIPAPLSDKTECPPEVEPERAAATLASEIEVAIAAGRCSRLRDGEWPRYAWGRTSFLTETGDPLEVVWEARIVNRDQGAYKAYPVMQNRHSQLMPVEVEEQLWPAR